jgi:hypothetical protein
MSTGTAMSTSFTDMGREALAQPGVYPAMAHEPSDVKN